MGRPSFKIDHRRLRSLREEKGLTQLALATEVGKRLSTSKEQADATLTSHYQRIERRGRTSRKTAAALADALGVSVPLLQGLEGPEPSDYLWRIKTALRRRLDQGAPAALVEALAAQNVSDPEEALEWLAEDVGELIEAVQLGRNPAAIADLAARTGLSESELLEPANVRGHWFVTVTSRGRDPSDDILRGVGAVNYHIREIVCETLKRHHGDCAIRMRIDKPWFRLEVTWPHLPRPMRIDFVRCQPDAKGLRWIDSSWRDDFEIEDVFHRWACDAANFVTDFSGRSSPGDLHRLRLRVTWRDDHTRATGQLVIRGRFEEIHETTKKNFKDDHSSHLLFVSYLATDLWLILAPHLAKHPAARWRLSNGACIDLDLDFAAPGRDCPRYRISLEEEVSPGELVPVPWRERDKIAFREQLEELLRNDLERAGGGPLVDFEPIQRG